jgi:prepilin-type N-terminal cleavage/methylation domain-containing protein/prepilin-type processing-associated H-X9-DG protein
MRAFTLIELLVVIAIIALLLSIILPALNLVKRKAASAVCLTNAKNLSLAWFSYQEENDSRLVNPNPSTVKTDGTHDDPSYIGWVVNPIRPDGTMCLGGEGPTNPVTDEDEIRGIKKGALYEYLKDPGVYHCPADNQRESKDDGSKIFRTYSSPRAMKMVTRFTRITTPGMRFNFIEEAEGRNWNMGTWDFYNMAEHGYWEWRDPVGNNHGDSGILGFCDGHAEVHKWQTSYTLDRVEYFFANIGVRGYGLGGLLSAYPRGPSTGSPPADQDPDIAYVAKSWANQ